MEEAHFLLVYYCDPLGLLTIQDGVKNLQQLSEHNISLLNLYPLVKIPSHINLNDFDGIVIDSTLTYFPSTLNALVPFPFNSDRLTYHKPCPIFV